MRFEIITTVAFIFICAVTNGQPNQTIKNKTIDLTDNTSNSSHITLKIESGVKSKELIDFYQFERINYYNLIISGSKIGNQYFILTSEEFWNSKLTQKDTLANTKLYNFKNGSDTLEFRVMSKSIYTDTVKFQFYLPRFSTFKKYKTLPRDIYSLRDITSGQIQTFDRTNPIIFLAYSLPYEDPKKPGHMFYCQLSKDGIPPEKWGEKFGVKHYIIFKIHLID
jgi:hypothetical protein